MYTCLYKIKTCMEVWIPDTLEVISLFVFWALVEDFYCNVYLYIFILSISLLLTLLLKSGGARRGARVRGVGQEIKE